MLLDREVRSLSGGELQRVAITMCLGRPSDVYLIDEPSTDLDSEERIVVAKVQLFRYFWGLCAGAHSPLRRIASAHVCISK